MVRDEELKRYLGLESDMGYDPFSDTEEQQDIAPGPTPENPYKFTEHSKNVQGSMAAGRNVQGISGRSQFDGIRPSGMMRSNLYQDMLPMKEVSVATGDLSKYEGKVTDPYSLTGRQEIAKMSDYAGTKEQTNVFDMKLIGESMGFSDEQIGTLINPEHETVYGIKGADPNLERGIDESIPMEEWRTKSEWDSFYKEQAMTSPPPKLSGREAFDARDTAPPTEFNAQDYITRERVDPATYSGLPEGVGKTEADFLIGLGMLSDTDGSLDLDLNKAEHINYVRNLGQSSSSRSSQFLGSPEKTGRYEGAAGDPGSLREQQKFINRGIDKSDDEPEKWKNIMQTAIITTVIAGMTYGVGAALAPAAGAVVSGAVAGGAGSVMSQTAFNRGQPIDWGQVAMGAGVGGVAGGVSSTLSSGGQVAGQSATGQLANKVSAMDAIKGLGPSVVEGGVMGYQQTEAEVAAMAKANQELRSANVEKVANIKQAREEFNNLFGIRADDPYADYREDIGSAQEGIV